MKRRICTVEKSFTALMVESQDKRVFRPRETLFWDGVESDPVTFEFDGIFFEAELKQFLTSVRPPI
jgi:hypothetical protein